VLRQRREVGEHLFGEPFVTLTFQAHKRNILVAMGLSEAHRLLHLRVDRVSGYAERVFRADKICDRQVDTLVCSGDVSLVNPSAEVVWTDNRLAWLRDD
jgi:hypothetical protein